MQIIKTIKEMQSMSRKLRAEGRTMGLVPTMGALHEGHLSLVRYSRGENDLTVVSIFVNPVQFGPDEDYQKYPRDKEGDLGKLLALDVDAVFMPYNSEMYPDDFSISVRTGSTGQVLCGVSRPGHFDGVATVVAKLFNAVMPDRAYFGQKDYQQTVVIKKLARELNFGTEVVVCPIVRELDGLAMSSRNAYLNDEQRSASLILYRALKLGEKLILSGGMADVLLVREEMVRLIETESLVDMDYVEIVNPDDLAPIQAITPPVLICIAVKIGNTRLIDNIIVRLSK